MGQCCSKAEVLLVDDIRLNLIYLKAMIENENGPKCDEATNGREAVEMHLKSLTKTCCDVRYKCIFTDIQMPVMDGFEEAKHVLENEINVRRGNPHLPKVKIVMVVNTELNAQLCEKMALIGLTDYVHKPHNRNEILPIIREVFPVDLHN